MSIYKGLCYHILISLLKNQVLKLCVLRYFSSNAQRQNKRFGYMIQVSVSARTAIILIDVLVYIFFARVCHLFKTFASGHAYVQDMMKVGIEDPVR